MKAAVLLTNNYFVAVMLVLGWAVETHPCNTKWIRLVYMMSCGKKKRESVWAQNDTFYENLPSDFDGAFKYYKEKDPFNPMFDDPFFYEILQEDGDSPRIEYAVPKLLIFGNDAREHAPRNPASTTTTTTTTTTTAQTPRTPPLLIKKLLPKAPGGNHLGIQGFPAQWDIEEIVDEKINENHRREIDRLIEECCKVPPVTSCNGNTFSGACK